MKSILQDTYGDFKKVDGDFQLIGGHEEVCQQIRDILRSNVGEFSLADDDYGIHYENILGKKINAELIKDEVRLGISQCSKDITIESIEVGYSKEHRLLYVEFRAFDSDGQRYDNAIELTT